MLYLNAMINQGFELVLSTTPVKEVHICKESACLRGASHLLEVILLVHISTWRPFLLRKWEG